MAGAALHLGLLEQPEQEQVMHEPAERPITITPGPGGVKRHAGNALRRSDIPVFAGACAKKEGGGLVTPRLDAIAGAAL
jgi:hypothetical protein